VGRAGGCSRPQSSAVGGQVYGYCLHWLPRRGPHLTTAMEWRPCSCRPVMPLGSWVRAPPARTPPGEGAADGVGGMPLRPALLWRRAWLLAAFSCAVACNCCSRSSSSAWGGVLGRQEAALVSRRLFDTHLCKMASRQHQVTEQAEATLVLPQTHVKVCTVVQEGGTLRLCPLLEAGTHGSRERRQPLA
jgi:hypothetical protein